MQSTYNSVESVVFFSFFISSTGALKIPHISAKFSACTPLKVGLTPLGVRRKIPTRYDNAALAYLQGCGRAWRSCRRGAAIGLHTAHSVVMPERTRARAGGYTARGRRTGAAGRREAGEGWGRRAEAACRVKRAVPRARVHPPAYYQISVVFNGNGLPAAARRADDVRVPHDRRRRSTRESGYRRGVKTSPSESVSVFLAGAAHRMAIRPRGDDVG